MKENLLEMKFRVLMLCDLKRSEILNAVKLFSEFVQKGDYGKMDLFILFIY